jgi:hypothetical protein
MSVARQTAEMLPQMSTLPPSFDGNPFLYAAALTSVMAIACLGLAVTGWMGRDTWRDRFNLHPNTLLFGFRTMMGLIGFASFMRAMPEVLYLQVYGDPDVSAQTQASILMAKRVADALSLWVVLAWMAIMVAIYPHVSLALRTGPARHVQSDLLGTWPRFYRPTACLVVIMVVAVAFAYGKVYAH